MERSRCRAGTSGTVRCAFLTAGHGRGSSTDGPRDHDGVDDVMDATAGPQRGARHRWADGAAGGEAQEAAPLLPQLVAFLAAGDLPGSDGTIGAGHEPPEALLAWWRRVCEEEAGLDDAPPVDLGAIASSTDEPITDPERWGKGVADHSADRAGQDAAERRSRAEIRGWPAVDGHQRRNCGWHGRHRGNVEVGRGLKVREATKEEHRRKGGDPDVDVPFQWLYMFFEPDDKRIEQIRAEYKSGRMLTGDLKDILIQKVTTFLSRHRQRREKASDLVHLYKKDGALAREMWTRDFSKS